MKQYSHSFANYPTGFKGCVISPTKLCLQFLDPQIKLRVDSTERHTLPKLPTNDRYIAVSETGIQIKITSIGCQLPIVEQCQLGLIDAYTQYYRLHNATYTKEYNKDFTDFIRQVYSKLGCLLTEMEKTNGTS